MIGRPSMIATAEPSFNSVRNFEQTNMPVIERNSRSTMEMTPNRNISTNLQIAQEIEELEELFEVEIKEQKSKLSERQQKKRKKSQRIGTWSKISTNEFIDAPIINDQCQEARIKTK